MPDRSFLQWPFFDDAHRDFEAHFRKWVTAKPVVHEDASAAVGAKNWVGHLAFAGWLQLCLDLDVRMLCLARETLAYHDPLADFAFAMQGLGSAPISLFGTPRHKLRYLPDVTAGTRIMAFALSEREAGSDVQATATTAVRDGDDYVLNGEKTWISNAGIAHTYVVFARTGNGSRGLSAFLVDGGAAGLTIDASIETISPHPIGTLRLRDVRVPAGDRLGEEGDGLKVALTTLDVFRPTVGAAALGLARRAFDESVRQARDRKIFGATLGDLQLTQSAIAHMAADIDASALLVYRAAWAKDHGTARITREAALAKWYATEAASRVADRAVQLFGGRGVTKGEIVERIYRDVRALRIYEGASEVQQVVIARSVLT